MVWNPDDYLAFADHRGRPLFDLLARVGAQTPRRVVDLGCGPGTMTLLLKQRWPDATVEALDSSPDMVAAARERGIDADLGDVTQWRPRFDTDVVVSNAVLQWVPGHADLLTGWATAMSPGAWIAVQVPGNNDAPSHRAVREVARRPEFAPALRGMRFAKRRIVETPLRYAELLSAAGCVVDAWETTYVHELTGRDPVLQWLSGTALTEARSRLSDGEWQEYRRQIAPLLSRSYPVRVDGRTLYPFRRVFVVARVT